MPSSSADELPAAVAAAESRLVLVTRQGCHLCEQAAQTLAEVAADQSLTTLDVDTDAELKAHLTDHVPVIYLDGRLLTYWTLSSDQLRQALNNPGWTSPPPL